MRPIILEYLFPTITMEISILPLLALIEFRRVWESSWFFGFCLHFQCFIFGLIFYLKFVCVLCDCADLSGEFGYVILEQSALIIKKPFWFSFFQSSFSHCVPLFVYIHGVNEVSCHHHRLVGHLSVAWFRDVVPVCVVVQTTRASVSYSQCVNGVRVCIL